MRLSVCYKSEVEACLLLDNTGRIVDSHIDKYIVQDNPSTAQYKGLIHAFTVGFKLLNRYMDLANEGTETNENVVIETNNTAFLAWVGRAYALPQYETEFMNMLECLRDIPMQYEIIYNKDLIAKQYAKPSMVQKTSISRLKPLL